MKELPKQPQDIEKIIEGEPAVFRGDPWEAEKYIRRKRYGKSEESQRGLGGKQEEGIEMRKW